MTFKQLTLTSHLRGAENPTLAEIVRSADQHHRGHNITGMLLYRDGSLVQVIEGDESEVDAVVHSIRLDMRYSDVFVLTELLVSEREFCGWSAGVRGGPAALGQTRNYPLDETVFDLQSLELDRRVRPGLGLTLLRSFVEQSVLH